MISTLIFLYVTYVKALNFDNNACTTLSAYPSAAIDPNCYYNPDVLSDFHSIIERHGYVSKTYTVTTDDGYILDLFRGSSPQIPVTRCPVLLNHGLLQSANTGNNSLAFKLVEMCYDLWLANTRGTTSANKHVNLTFDDPEYWNFNLDTLSTVDLSAQLNLVANNTGRKGDVLYIGYSQGTTIIFMYASRNYQEASRLLQGIIAFAPVAYWAAPQPYVKIAPLLKDDLEAFNVKGLFYQETIIHVLLVRICKIFPIICVYFQDSIVGKLNQFAAEYLLVQLSYTPTGTSLYQMAHFAQLSSNQRLEQYDYGYESNMKAYSSAAPPLYNLTNIKLPVHLFYGLGDALVLPNHVFRLYNELGSKEKYKYKFPAEDDGYSFNHVYFVYSKYLSKFHSELFKVLNSFYSN